MPRGRWIPDHSLVEIPSRCFQGRFLLRPSPALNRAILGVLGRALERHPVQVHYLAVLFNHLLATFPSTGVMSEPAEAFYRRIAGLDDPDHRGPDLADLIAENRRPHSGLDL